MSTRTKDRFEVPYAVPPGETLEETIAALEMTQADLARRTGLTPKTINQIVKGKAPITPDTALSLEKATRVPARLWNNLEANYQEALSRIAEREALEQDLDLLDDIPVKELMNRGALDPTRDRADLLRQVLVFFGVADRKSWEAVWLRPAAAFKQSERLKAHPAAVASWLRLGELEASEQECSEYSHERFRDALQSIRGMTLWDVERYLPEMTGLCAQSGVALVFVPEITGARAWGATRWLTPTKAMIQLSLRYKWEDHFWFSFFHEAAHVLLHGKRLTFVDSSEVDSHLEDEANEFAARKLIPRRYEGELPALTTLRDIEAFADRIGIHAGIVVGRLQREGFIGYSVGHGLRRKLEFVDT